MEVTSTPSKRWWTWLWPLRSSPHRVGPDRRVGNLTTSGSKLLKPFVKGGQSYPSLSNNNYYLRAQETQTYKNELNMTGLFSPRSLKSMQKFPVDDDYDIPVAEQERSKNVMSEILSKEKDKIETQDQDPSSYPEIKLETDIFHTVSRSRDPFYAPHEFIIMCCFQIIWGIVGVIQVAVLRYTKTIAQTYILLDKNFSDHSAFYLLVGASLTTIGGICGLLALSFNIQFMLHLIPHFMWIIVTMCLCSSITARGNLEKPTVSTYYRIFEAAALYSQDSSYLKDSWPHIPPTIWDDMQKTMRCCGVENITDWLHLPGHTIPESCCLDDLRTCRQELNLWNLANATTGELIDSLEQVHKYLIDDSCVTVLTLERGNHIRDWTTYPLIYLVFHLLMMFNINFLTQILIHEYRSWEGLARLQQYKSQSTDLFKARLVSALLGMIPCGCKRIKDKARWHVEKQTSQNVLSVIANRKNSIKDGAEMGPHGLQNDYEGHGGLPNTNLERKPNNLSLVKIEKGPTEKDGGKETKANIEIKDPHENVSEWIWKKPQP